MASVEKRIRDGRVRWYARYRDPNGRQLSRSFDRKADAERFLTGVESSKLTGSYVDPALARLTVGEWAAQWFDGQVHLSHRHGNATRASCASTSPRGGLVCGSQT